MPRAATRDPQLAMMPRYPDLASLVEPGDRPPEPIDLLDLVTASVPGSVAGRIPDDHLAGAPRHIEVGTTSALCPRGRPTVDDRQSQQEATIMATQPTQANRPQSKGQEALVLGAVALWALGWLVDIAATWIAGGHPSVSILQWRQPLHVTQWLDHGLVAWRAVGGSDHLVRPVYYAVAALLGSAAVVAVVWVGLRVDRRRRRRHRADVRGLATRADIRANLGEPAILSQADVLRHSLERPTRTDVCIALGRDVHYRQPIYGSIEDSYVLLGPPGCGKTSGFMVGAVIDFPGPAVVTSTKSELLDATAAARSRSGPIWVFDPLGVVPANVMARMGWHQARWDPVRGSSDPRVAIRRATVAVTASGAGRGVTNGTFWTASAIAAGELYFHAAALAGADLRTVASWVFDPSDDAAVDILLDDERAAPGWGDRLRQAIPRSADDRERHSVFHTLQRAFDAVAVPEVMESCCPGDDLRFNPAEFVRERGTLYLVGDPEDQRSVAPLVTMLVDAIMAEARRRAATLPGGRLDPPVGFFLDEATQIAPLASLPSAISDGRGIGLPIVVVVQTWARPGEVWGEAGAKTIWQNAVAKVIFGGVTDTDELERLSRLCGEYEEPVVNRSRSAGGWGETHSSQRRRRMSPDEIRELPPGQALVMYRGMRPVITHLTPYWEGPHALEIKAALDEIKAALAETAA
jgi:type IV secretory pathway TraG/TraD family ATPase VirD4